MFKLENYIYKFNKENKLREKTRNFYKRLKLEKIKKNRNKIKKIYSYSNSILKKINNGLYDTESKIEEIKKLSEIKSKIKVSKKRYKSVRNKKNYLTEEKCFICGQPAYCMHHIIPISRGGDNSENNLKPICRNCHKKVHPFMK